MGEEISNIKWATRIDLLTSPSFHEGDAIIILQKRTLKHRELSKMPEVIYLESSRWCDLHSSTLAPKFVHLDLTLFEN